MESIQLIQGEGQIAGDFCVMRCEQVPNLQYRLNCSVTDIQTVSSES